MCVVLMTVCLKVNICRTLGLFPLCTPIIYNPNRRRLYIIGIQFYTLHICYSFTIIIHLLQTVLLYHLIFISGTREALDNVPLLEVCEINEA